MGHDKAFAPFEGRPLAEIARCALVEAGAVEVLSIGGDGARLAALGFTAIPDDAAGQGPLGGLLTALRVATADWVAVLATDLPHASAATVRELLGHAGDGSDAVVPLLEGRPQPAHAVWRRDCRQLLEPLFAAGERRLREALAHVRTSLVTVSDPMSLRDVDTPGDLQSLRAPPRGTPGAVTGSPADPAGAGTAASRRGT